MKTIIFEKIEVSVALARHYRYVCIPKYPSDYEEYKKLNGEFKARITQPRNLKHHKKLFAIANLAVDNGAIEKLDYSENIINGIIASYKDEAYCLIYLAKFQFLPLEKYRLPDRRVQERVSSISFESMDQVQFNEFYDKFVNWVADLLDIQRQVLEHESLNYM